MALAMRFNLPTKRRSAGSSRPIHRPRAAARMLSARMTARGRPENKAIGVRMTSAKRSIKLCPVCPGGHKRFTKEYSGRRPQQNQQFAKLFVYLIGAGVSSGAENASSGQRLESLADNSLERFGRLLRDLLRQRREVFGLGLQGLNFLAGVRGRQGDGVRKGLGAGQRVEIFESQSGIGLEGLKGLGVEFGKPLGEDRRTGVERAKGIFRGRIELFDRVAGLRYAFFGDLASLI